MSLGEEKQSLNAFRATLILVVVLAVQFGTAIAVEPVYQSLTHIQNGDPHNAQPVHIATGALIPVANLIATIMGGLVMLVLSALLIRNSITETAPNGAAWTVGSLKNNCLGLVLGIFISIGYTVVIAICNPGVPVNPRLPKISEIVTLPEMCTMAYVLIFVPSTEELLFRGIVYGGYRRSFGAFWAAAFTTFGFSLLHVHQMTLPALSGIVILAFSTLWFRLRAAAIGPAIAVHLGYNAVSVAVSYILR